MRRRRLDLLILTSVFIAASFFLYLYFWFFDPSKLEVVYQNWDGPVYIVIAQSFYKPEIISSIKYTYLKDPEDFASSFPLYPVLIRLLSPVGYFRAMILASVMMSLATILAFYELASRSKLVKNPLILSIIFIFLPPRWFISSHIGSSEPLFMFLVLLSLIFFLNKRYWFSGLSLGFAQLTRSQGILFFAAFSLIFLGIFLKDQDKLSLAKIKKYSARFFPFLLAPTALLLLFSYFDFQYGNFWAFFEAISKWPVMASYPFEVFASYPHQLLPTFWIENHFWIYFVDILAILVLVKKRLYWLATLSGVYFLPLPFLIHIDLARYNLPMIPFLLLAFEEKIGTKLFLIATILMIPALYAYSINFMLWNR